MGIYLPELPKLQNGNIAWESMPARFADNRKSKYATRHNWDLITADEGRVADAIEVAFQNRINLKDKIDNSRPQMQRNLT